MVVVSQNNNTSASTFQNAVLSNFVYMPDSSPPPVGYTVLRTYDSANARVLLVGKIDAGTGQITSLETVVRGTRFSDLNANSLIDLSSDANISKFNDASETRFM